MVKSLFLMVLRRSSDDRRLGHLEKRECDVGPDGLGRWCPQTLHAAASETVQQVTLIVGQSFESSRIEEDVLHMLDHELQADRRDLIHRQGSNLIGNDLSRRVGPISPRDADPIARVSDEGRDENGSLEMSAYAESGHSESFFNPALQFRRIGSPIVLNGFTSVGIIDQAGQYLRETQNVYAETYNSQK